MFGWATCINLKNVIFALLARALKQQEIKFLLVNVNKKSCFDNNTKGLIKKSQMEIKRQEFKTEGISLFSCVLNSVCCVLLWALSADFLAQLCVCGVQVHTCMLARVCPAVWRSL